MYKRVKPTLFTLSLELNVEDTTFNKINNFIETGILIDK